MEEKNYKIFIVPIIAVSIFVLLIFGAGYAYFAADIANAGNVANINLTLPEDNTLFSCVSTSCDMTVNAADMVSSQSNNDTAKANKNCTLSCTLSGIKGVKCTYNVNLTAVSAYTPTAGVTTKEFTGQLSLPTASGNSSATAATISGNLTTNEVQINTLAGKSLANATIEVPQAGTITQIFTFEEKWYNVNKDQSTHAGHTYQYTLGATNVQC